MESSLAKIKMTPKNSFARSHRDPMHPYHLQKKVFSLNALKISKNDTNARTVHPTTDGQFESLSILQPKKQKIHKTKQSKHTTVIPDPIHYHKKQCRHRSAYFKHKRTTSMVKSRPYHYTIKKAPVAGSSACPHQQHKMTPISLYATGRECNNNPGNLPNKPKQQPMLNR